MLSKRTGASIISLVLCFVAIMLVTTALVVANNNSIRHRAYENTKTTVVEDGLAYVRIYTISEVKQIARQAFANNYLALYEKKVDLVEFEALVLGEIANKIGMGQLDKYTIYVTPEDVTVQYK